MKEYFDCLIMTHGTAFGAGAAIFLLTVLLVARRIVGFFLSVILMLIALGASWAINNESFVRSHLDKWIPTTQNAPANRAETKAAPAPAATETQAAPASTEGSDNLKGQVDTQKAKVKGFLDESK